MKVAIYGGAFDPPHIGHSHVLALLERSKLFDQIWLLPSADRVDKSISATGKARCEMLELVATDFSTVSVCKLQVEDQSVPNTTYEFMTYINSKYPDREFSFVIGSELVEELNTWKHAERLHELQFVVVARPGSKIEKNPNYKLSVLEQDHTNLAIQISSTDIRDLVAQSESLVPYLNPIVRHYISSNGLYGLVATDTDLTVFKGKFIETKIEHAWEYVARIGCDATVGIIACFEKQLILVEQYRPPRKKQVIELPAGLVGDLGYEAEQVEAAAARELYEETGFKADSFSVLGAGPTTAGLSSEYTYLLVADQLIRTSEGGGNSDENITVHLVDISDLDQWLRDKQEQGYDIDLKVYTAVYYCKQCDR